MSTLEFVIIGALAAFLAKRQFNWPLSNVTAAAIGLGGAMMGTGVAQALLPIDGTGAGVVGAILGAVALVWVWQRSFAEDTKDNDTADKTE